MDLNENMTKIGIEFVEKVNRDYILVKTKYGIHKVQPGNLLRSNALPNAVTAIDKHVYWSNRILENNPDIEITSIISSMEDKVLFTDKYGDCVSSVKSLVNKGHNIKCALNKTTYFINKCLEIHSNKYNYDKLMYTKSSNKVIITCNTHGDFEQQAGRHLLGQGCSKCALQENRGLNETSLRRLSIEEQNKDSFLYVIALSKDTEQFYKIGITVNLENRLKQFHPYKVKLLKLRKLPLIDSVILEKELHKINNNNHYVPAIHFCGSKNECFKSLEDATYR